MSMDRRQREALDRHITGNYGEDQFRGMGDEDEDGEAAPIPHTSSREDGGDALAEERPTHLDLDPLHERRRGNCGCELVRHGSYVQVYQCAMHAAAEEMLGTLTDVERAADGGLRCDLCDGYDGHNAGCPIPRVKAVIGLARGQ